MAQRRERGVLLVVLLTAAMMVVEITVGYATHSMALLADGWHMATHVGALGLASLAYSLARRHASNRAFAFGTGKVRALAGYTSAVALGLVAVAMLAESASRFWHPEAIDFKASLPVAIVGLVVNLASVLLLDAHDDEDGHHDHDHNHRAAFLHVAADTFTSALAIVALLAGRFWGLTWLDALSGVLGGLVILKWGSDLVRQAGFELLDIVPSPRMEDEIRSTLEAIDDVRIFDLHVWSLGSSGLSCLVTLESAAPRAADVYRQALSHFDLAHLTIEVRRCSHEREPRTPDC
ncbi:MAG TPA: CDF family Co(II)/Ni(II) efflux transporter DmeF [Polyangiaceae bacterium]|nr:CDF family Co(II)/Ni(II) efflux transporter DmeF [Polyangiaceae bacterium]